MPFRPKVNETILVTGNKLTFTEHPCAPGLPYGQTGRRATVFQVHDAYGAYHALKVFTQAFRSPQTEIQAAQIARYAGLPGLAACQRTVFSPSAHAELINTHPDLKYAVLMPWIDGLTWQGMILNRQPISRGQSLLLVEDIVRTLAVMENHSLAHCDLSGPNVIVNLNAQHLNGNGSLALIDLEDLYAPGLTQPEKLPAGSSGYAHCCASEGLWSQNADRFAAAVLIAEMLGWCSEAVRQAACGEQYFDPLEMQKDCERFHILADTLAEFWGSGTAHLFEQAWIADQVENCPSFAEWASQLKVNIPAIQIEQAESSSPPLSQSDSPVKGWRNLAGQQVGDERFSLPGKWIEDRETEEFLLEETKQQAIPSNETREAAPHGLSVETGSNKRPASPKLMSYWGVIWIGLSLALVMYDEFHIELDYLLGYLSIPIVAGFIIGGVIGLVLKRENILSSWWNVLWIILGWITGFLIFIVLAPWGYYSWEYYGNLSFFLAVLVGSGITGVILVRERALASLFNVGLMAIGYAITWFLWNSLYYFYHRFDIGLPLIVWLFMSTGGAGTTWALIMITMIRHHQKRTFAFNVKIL